MDWPDFDTLRPQSKETLTLRLFDTLAHRIHPPYFLLKRVLRWTSYWDFRFHMAIQVEDRPGWLLQLPYELLYHILETISEKRDIYHLSLSCRALERLVASRLYAKVDVQLPQNQSQVWSAGEILRFRPQVIQSIRELTVRNGTMDMSNPVFHRRRRSDAGTVDGYIAELVDQIPQNQLQSFSYLHRSPMSERLLNLLAKQHRALRGLRVYEISPLDTSAVEVPENLVALEYRSLPDSELSVELVEKNKKTLQQLKLGQEKYLVGQYRQGPMAFAEATPQPANLFRFVQQVDLPRLQDLDLCGLDIRPILPTTLEQASIFRNLSRLSLESCIGAETLLDSLAALYDLMQHPGAQQPPSNPKLTTFLLRAESPSVGLRDALMRFLGSFAGLTTLSLLFENSVLLGGVSAFIAEHGPTLRTLVLESRIQPRQSLALDTSRPFGVGRYSQQIWEESINDICALCPNLVELGIGFPWGDETVRLRQTRLPLLQHLKTIHIRNFPESSTMSQLGDYTIKEYASKFIDWAYPALSDGRKPNLETLAVGPTLYESRWNDQSARKQPPEFLRTHYYCLDWATTRFRQWAVLISPVSERCMEEVRGEKPLAGCFEQVWLK